MPRTKASHSPSGRSGGRSRLQAKRASAEAEACIVVGRDGGPGQVGFLAKLQRSCILRACHVGQCAQGQPAQSLIPIEEVASGIVGWKVAAISATHDAELVRKLAPHLRRGVGETRHHARVGEQGQDFLARKRSERKGEQELDCLCHAVAGRRRQIRHVMGQIAALAEHRRELRQVDVLAGFGHDDRDVAQSQRRIPARERPDLRGHHLQLAPQ
jgi:hypothetical protein